MKQTIIEALLLEYKTKHGIDVNLAIERQNKLYLRNGHVSTQAASLIKLFIFGAVIKAIGRGILDYKQGVSISKADFVGGSGILKYALGESDHLVEDLIHLMMMFSDNIATNKLLEIISIQYVQTFIDEIKAHNTQIIVPMMPSKEIYGTASNTTSVYDVLHCYKVLVGAIPSPIFKWTKDCRNILKRCCGNKLINIKFMLSLLNCKMIWQVVRSNPSALHLYLKAALWKSELRLTNKLPPALLFSRKSATGTSVFHDACVLQIKGIATFIVAMATSESANYSKPNSPEYIVTRRLFGKIGQSAL